jgi:GntR family transcriptional regulator
MDHVALPLYQQVKEDIKAAIENGRYKPQEKIPAEPELSAEYSVSRITVRRAIEELCSEGYLVKMQGRGTFVSSPRIHRKMFNGNEMESFSRTCRNSGMRPGAKLLDRKIVPVRENEMAFFGCGKDALLLYIQRVRTADGLPIFLENLFFHYETFKDLMSVSWDDVSAFETIYAVTGKKPTKTGYRTIEIARASAEQAQVLGVPLGEPLLHMNVQFLDQTGSPLCIGRQYYVGSRYMFEF